MRTSLSSPVRRWPKREKSAPSCRWYPTTTTEHDVNIVITEQGVADLRGKSPKERAQAIIENCAHPDYKQLLWDYLKIAGGKAQTPHAIQAALGMHAELAKSGDMKNTDWAEYAK